MLEAKKCYKYGPLLFQVADFVVSERSGSTALIIFTLLFVNAFIYLFFLFKSCLFSSYVHQLLDWSLNQYIIFHI